eukprot:g61967.t1
MLHLHLSLVAELGASALAGILAIFSKSLAWLHPWQKLSESHRVFIAADAAQPLSSSPLYGKSHICVAYGKSLDVCAAALTPEISIALTPDFWIRNPVAKLLE